MSDFDQIMKRKSDLQLLEIVERDASKYAKEALNAAKNELAARSISEDDAKEARSQLDAIYEKKASRKNRIESIVGHVNSDAQALADTLDGVDQTEERSRNIVIKLIVVFLAYNLFWLFYPMFDYFVIQHGIYLSELWSIDNIMSFIFAPIIIMAIYGLLMEKRSGWMATVGFMSYVLALKVVGLYFDIKNYIAFGMPTGDFDDESSGGIFDLIDGLLFGNMDPSLFLLMQIIGLMIVFFIIRYFLNPDMCFKFQVSDKIKQNTILTGFLLGLVFAFSMSWFYF